jgi:hypothetical protein
VYDPGADAWTELTETLSSPRAFDATTLDASGAVVISGGQNINALEGGWRSAPANSEGGGPAQDGGGDLWRLRRAA